jgi:hypothetical protein
MKASVDSNSPAVTGRVEARRSALSTALSVLAAGATFFGAGAALASPSSMSPADGLLAFHVE